MDSFVCLFLLIIVIISSSCLTNASKPSTEGSSGGTPTLQRPRAPVSRNMTVGTGATTTTTTAPRPTPNNNGGIQESSGSGLISKGLKKQSLGSDPSKVISTMHLKCFPCDMKNMKPDYRCYAKEQLNTSQTQESLIDSSLAASGPHRPALKPILGLRLPAIGPFIKWVGENQLIIPYKKIVELENLKDADPKRVKFIMCLQTPQSVGYRERIPLTIKGANPDLCLALDRCDDLPIGIYNCYLIFYGRKHQSIYMQCIQREVVHITIQVPQIPIALLFDQPSYVPITITNHLRIPLQTVKLHLLPYKARHPDIRHVKINSTIPNDQIPVISDCGYFEVWDLQPLQQVTFKLPLNFQLFTERRSNDEGGLAEPLLGLANFRDLFHVIAWGIQQDPHYRKDSNENYWYLLGHSDPFYIYDNRYLSTENSFVLYEPKRPSNFSNDLFNFPNVNSVIGNTTDNMLCFDFLSPMDRSNVGKVHRLYTRKGNQHDLTTGQLDYDKHLQQGSCLLDPEHPSLPEGDGPILTTFAYMVGDPIYSSNTTTTVHSNEKIIKDCFYKKGNSDTTNSININDTNNSNNSNNNQGWDLSQFRTGPCQTNLMSSSVCLPTSDMLIPLGFDFNVVIKLGRLATLTKCKQVWLTNVRLEVAIPDCIICAPNLTTKRHYCVLGTTQVELPRPSSIPTSNSNNNSNNITERNAFVEVKENPDYEHLLLALKVKIPLREVIPPEIWGQRAVILRIYADVHSRAKVNSNNNSNCDISVKRYVIIAQSSPLTFICNPIIISANQLLNGNVAINYSSSNIRPNPKMDYKENAVIRDAMRRMKSEGTMSQGMVYKPFWMGARTEDCSTEYYFPPRCFSPSKDEDATRSKSVMYECIRPWLPVRLSILPDNYRRLHNLDPNNTATMTIANSPDLTAKMFTVDDSIRLYEQFINDYFPSEEFESSAFDEESTIEESCFDE